MPLPFLSCQHVIVRLVLEFRRLQKRAELGAEKLNRIALVGLPSQTHPDQVNVVWHKAVSRAEESFPTRRVEHHLAKRGVEALIEPASLPVGDGHSPENDGVGLIEFPAQTREIMGKIGTRFTLRSGRGRFVVHGRGRLAPTSVGANVSWVS